MTSKGKKSHAQRLVAAATRVLGPGKFNVRDAVALIAKIEQATDRVVARNLSTKSSTKHTTKLNNG